MKYPKEQVAARLSQFHKQPGDIPGMAYEIWEDGEVTLTKCSNGELYGARGLHCIFPGVGKSLPLDVFPECNTSHAFVRCDSDSDAMLCREIVLSNLEITD